MPVLSHAASDAAGRWLVRLLLAAAAAIVFVPLLLTFYLSVFDETLITFPPHAYTVRWYARILPEFGGALRTSLLVALTAVAISLLLGVPAAIGLARHRFRGPRRAVHAAAGAADGAGHRHRPGHLRRRRADRGADGVAAQRLRAPHGRRPRADRARPGWCGCAWPPCPTATRRQRRPPPASAPRPGACCGASRCRPCAAASWPGALFAFIVSFENLEMTLFLTAPGMTTLPISVLQYLQYHIDPLVAAVAVAQVVLVGAALLLLDRLVPISRAVA